MLRIQLIKRYIPAKLLIFFELFLNFLLKVDLMFTECLRCREKMWITLWKVNQSGIL